MYKWAEEVSKKVEKSGGEARLNDDQSVTILMDGKVQEVISKDDRVKEIRRND